VEPWRPKREFAFTEVRSFLVFGGYTSVFSILAYLGSNLHQLMIGIASGPEAAGYFNRAFILVLAPVSLILAPVGGVITAALSRVQSDPPAFLRYYLNSMAAVNLMSAPLGCYSLVFAPELVRLLLGTSWAESGILLRLMAISILVQPLMYSSGWVYQSRGEVRRMFWWGNVGWGVILAMYLVGLAWGARGVAAAHSVALMFLIWPCLHFAYRGTMITTQNTLRVCTPALMAAVIAAVPAWGIREMLPNHSALIILIAGSTVYAGSYIGLLFALGETPRLIQLWGHLRPGAFA
jgi:O-antigen/teichoic acid export membrane protein